MGKKGKIVGIVGGVLGVLIAGGFISDYVLTNTTGKGIKESLLEKLAGYYNSKYSQDIDADTEESLNNVFAHPQKQETVTENEETHSGVEDLDSQNELQESGNLIQLNELLSSENASPIDIANAVAGLKLIWGDSMPDEVKNAIADAGEYIEGKVDENTEYVFMQLYGYDNDGRVESQTNILYDGSEHKSFEQIISLDGTSAKYSIKNDSNSVAGVCTDITLTEDNQCKVVYDSNMGFTVDENYILNSVEIDGVTVETLTEGKNVLIGVGENATKYTINDDFVNEFTEAVNYMANLKSNNLK